MTQATPEVFQMNQNLLLVKLMPTALTDIVHELSFMKKKKPTPFCTIYCYW